MRDLLISIQVVDVLEGFDQGRKSAMNANNFIGNDSRDGNVVEHVGEVLPHMRRVVFLLALHVETVVLSDSSCFMVSSDEYNPRWELDFQQTEQSNDLYRMSPSVNVVA